MSENAVTVSSAVLENRVIMINGAAGGLGAASALACAQAGATVVLLGRNLPRLERLYDQLTPIGPVPWLYPLDLQGASPDDYAELAQRIGDNLGRLDGLLHCAADFPGLTPLELTDPLVFARTLHVNLTARVWLTQACLPLLRQRDDAAVVWVLDDTQRVGKAYWGGYGAAQYAQQGVIHSLHDELHHSPIRVCGLQAAPMRTPLRARAFTEDTDFVPLPPEHCAVICVELLSVQGQRWRGQIRHMAAAS